MGVPVVTLAGDAHVARVGVSLLARAGHPEWVATNRDDYVAIAAGLASNLEALAAHRSVLRDELRTSALTNVGRLARRARRDLFGHGCAAESAVIVRLSHAQAVEVPCSAG